MPESINLPDNVFRASAGAVIINSEGYVLAFERLEIPGAWQLPQGGINVDEEPLDAVKRELFEEARIGADKLQFLGEYPEWLDISLTKIRENQNMVEARSRSGFCSDSLGATRTSML